MVDNFIEVFCKKTLSFAIKAMALDGGVIHYHHPDGLTIYTFKPSAVVIDALHGIKPCLVVGKRNRLVTCEEVIERQEKRYRSIAYKATRLKTKKHV